MFFSISRCNYNAYRFMYWVPHGKICASHNTATLSEMWNSHDRDERQEQRGRTCVVVPIAQRFQKCNQVRFLPRKVPSETGWFHQLNVPMVWEQHKKNGGQVLGPVEKNIFIDWFNFYWDICSKWMASHLPDIGVEGNVVQVDESGDKSGQIPQRKAYPRK